MAEIKINIKGSTIECPHCGVKNPDSREFCVKCGTKFSSHQSNQDCKTCLKCGLKNRPGAAFCASCGKSLSKTTKKRQKRKLAKKMYKTSKIIVKSSTSSNFRNKTIKKVLNEVDDFKEKNYVKIDKTLREFNKEKTNEYGYLLCDSCPVYYKLDGKSSLENNQNCACGGKLIFSPKPRYSD
jgi:ribosomal protein L40E